MKVISADSVPAQAVQMEGSQGCTIRWLVARRDGAPTFAMRQIEIAPGGFTPCHQHPYEHEVYVLSGHGEVRQGEQVRRIGPGDVVYVAPGELHQFCNTGEEPLRFL